VSCLKPVTWRKNPPSPSHGRALVRHPHWDANEDTVHRDRELDHGGGAWLGNPSRSPGGGGPASEGKNLTRRRD